MEEGVTREKFWSINTFLMQSRGSEDDSKKYYHSDSELSCEPRGEKGSGGRLEAHTVRHEDSRRRKGLGFVKDLKYVKLQAGSIEA